MQSARLTLHGRRHAPHDTERARRRTPRRSPALRALRSRGPRNGAPSSGQVVAGGAPAEGVLDGGGSGGGIWQALARGPRYFLCSAWPLRALVHLLAGGVFGLGWQLLPGYRCAVGHAR